MRGCYFTLVYENVIKAIDEQDIDAVRSMIALGIDIHEKGNLHESYLMRAWFRCDDFEIIKLLIDNGAELNDPSYPAIVGAAFRQSPEMIQYVLDRGADINAISGDKVSALWHAAYEGNIALAKHLLDVGIDVTQVGGDALSLAASRNHISIVKLLIENNANINFQAFDSHPDRTYSPLHMAAWYGHLECVRNLLENGADPSLKNHYGERPYHLAKEGKRREIMELIATYLPKSVQDLDQRRSELKKAGLPKQILDDLGDESVRIELQDCRYMDYFIYCSIMDVAVAKIDGQIMISLLFETDDYDAFGFLVWLPSRKVLASYDVEHQNLMILNDVSWKQFRKSPGVIIDRIVDGVYEGHEV